jgi:hypothetical protein
MDLVKRIISLTVFASSIASAQNLSLTIGNSVAGQNFAMKSAAFVFRINGCADLSKAQVAATAEGSVNGERRSTPLRVVTGQPAGVYAVSQQWGAEGKWVVSITTNCGTETAAAIVPVNGNSFAREGVQMLPHAPSKSEVESALAAYTPPARAPQ